MKFSHSIQFNAVPDWSSHYIAYSNLKKLIYSLEKKSLVGRSQTDGEDTEHSALLAGDSVDTDSVFRKALDAELEKIAEFYSRKQAELLNEVRELDADITDFVTGNSAEFHLSDANVIAEGSSSTRPRTGSSAGKAAGRGLRRWRSHESGSEGSDSEESEQENEEEAGSGAGQRLLKRTNKKKSSAVMGASMISEAPSDYSFKRRVSVVFGEDERDHAMDMLYDKQVTLKKRAISLFVALRELKSYVQLNKTGFSKALKKYDKILQRSLRANYLDNQVMQARCFKKETSKELDETIEQIETLYANLVTEGDVAAAKRELRLHLREHVVWERNTVWREMIGIERKAHAANIGFKGTLLGDDRAKKQLAGDDEKGASMKEWRTPFGRLSIPVWLFGARMWTMLALVAVFVVLLKVPTFKTPEQSNCLAMLVFVSLLWATEIIPLFVTSLLIPFLVVVLGIARTDSKPHQRLEGKAAAQYIFSAMWTPVIMLLLGGFAIAAALSKYGIAKRMATFVLSKAGTRPRTVLVTNMFVAMFASMWISNVAAPVLCFSIIQPLLRNLPEGSDFSKALILGIALASNIGGMASPIASPQNIIALQNMRPPPSWGGWFFVALPVCILSILMIWVLLLVTFRPGKGTTIVPIRPLKDPFTGTEYFISITTVVTIVLWCVSHQLENVFGDMGVIAIIPLVLFFGTGVLSKEDFNNFLWTIIILAAGGLSLGKAVNSSGLLHTIAGSIGEVTEGMGLYAVLVIFCALILVIATFISHTVAALIILPIVAQVGAAMDEPHPNLLVMGSALMCSAAMGLPTSGFPNMTAIMMEDGQTGQRYLRVSHFIGRGIPASALTFVVVVTVGFGLMKVSGF